MSWFYLFIASLFEIGWPVGMKMATNSEYKIVWIIFAILAMGLSGLFLFFAQKTIPIGTAYAVWTGIGMIGTFIIGVTVFHDTANLMKFFGVFLILSGILILKLYK